MAFTDNCDLFAAVHEDGVNRVIQHIMRQRPSWFNYATADVASNPKLWCSTPLFTKDVTKYGNPIFKIEPPLPIIGSDSPAVFIGFCAQLVKAQIDFHPGNKIALPQELGPPLKPQHFSLQFRVCGGLECPSDDEVSQIPIGGASPIASTNFQGDKLPPIVLRGTPNCFCLDVFVIGHFEHSNGLLLGKVDDIDTVDVKPDQLEDNVNCYIKTAVNVILREKLVIPLEVLSLDIKLFKLATITLKPTLTVPNNPAIEDDELKVFITMTV
jgi:hypothetical protein